MMGLLGALLTAREAKSQVRPPKRHEADNLEQRYKDLKCALVLIQAGNSIGSGFYTSADGDLVTASHVLGDRTFAKEGDRFRINIQIPATITITNSQGQFDISSATTVETNADDWSADLATIKTAKTAPCWLGQDDDKSASPGQHVLALGFPGLAFGSLAIYSGIISARLKSGLIFGFTVDGQSLMSTNDFLRVQMPISTGLSGGPLIDDYNRVIAVVTNAGAWSPGLDALIRNTNQTPPASAADTSNLSALLAQLASVFHDYVSPGYGDCVPLSYLAKKAAPSIPKPASP
jgi:hypothetical protein